jgi:hypothetical protein
MEERDRCYSLVLSRTPHETERPLIKIIVIWFQALDTFPWETLPIINYHPVSRMENLHFLYYLYKLHQKNISDGYLNAKADVLRYVINPGEDLYSFWWLGVVVEEVDGPAVSALRRAIAEVTQRWSVIDWVTKNLLSRTPPCLGRNVKPLVPAAFVVVSIHQPAMGPLGGLWLVLLKCNP